MVTIFEGPRNSGKTFLALKFASISDLPIFKFEFVDWFKNLNLTDNEESTHLFALGKESMLMQLNRDGLLPEFILDRGVLTVMTWGILSGRITEQQAHDQLSMLCDAGLFKNIRIFYVIGDNPDKSSRNKDVWDFREEDNRESEIMESLRDHISNQPYNVQVEYIFNKFDEESVQSLHKLI